MCNMKTCIKRFFKFFLTALPLATYGQADGVIRQDLPTKNVMACNGVNRFLRDSEGYVWYATDENLCRDNGYQVDVFCSNERNPQLMKSNFIIDVAEDGNGHIWIGTSQGAYVLDKHDYSIHSTAVAEAQGVRIEAIYALHDGTVWLSTGNHLLHFDADEQLLQRIDISQRRLGPKFINAFMEDSRHTLWLLQSGAGILFYDREQRDFVPAPWQRGLDPQAMVEDVANKCYWVGLWGQGIVRYQPDAAIADATVTVAQDGTAAFADGSHANRGKILDIKVDPHGGLLWATAMDGMHAYRIDGDGRLQECDMPQIRSLAQYNLGNIMVDGLNNIWVGGSRYFMLLRGHEGIVRHDSPWHVMGNSALLDDSQRTLMAEAARHLNGLRINDACKDADGRICVATNHGLKRAKDSDWNMEQVTDSTDEVLRVVADADGTLYYQGRQAGLCMLLRGKRQAQPMLKNGETCSCLALLDREVLWIGTTIGRVYACETRNSHTLKPAPALSNAGGNRIIAIRQDAHGHVWSVTRHCLREWDLKSDSYRILECRHPRISMDYFDALVVCGDSMCAVGPEQYCMILPKDFDVPGTTAAQPLVSTVIVDGESHYMGMGQRTLEIPSHSRLVEIRLTTLQHHLAPQVQFAYRLHKTGLLGGADRAEAWAELPTGTNSIMLSSPAKGRYIIEVKATDGQGIWDAPADIFVLHRLPAWWESGWAIAVYVLCLLALALLAARQYSTAVRRRRLRQMEAQLSEMKFRFFTNISHELRTPLTLMLVPVEQMLTNDTLPERDRERLETIKRNAQELQQLIDHMLDFRRMELGDVHLNKRNGDMKALMAMAQDSFQSLAQHKHIDLRFVHDDANFYATFDHEKIRHVLWNLLSNAMKFTPEGGRVTMSLTTDTSLNELVVHVADTGTGLPESEIPHVFDRYYQSANASSQGGSGIGLNLVRETVLLHGGKVGVNSQEGHGADFWFTIPIHPQPQPATDKEHTQDDSVAADSPHDKGDETLTSILLVEDNVELRSLIANQLSDDGYKVLQAGDGQQAWDVLQQKDDIMLIVSDVMMPIMDGMELCRRVKTDENTSHLPVILLTAKTGDESRLEGYKMGADSYLTKPFSMAVLQSRIKHLLEQRQSQQQQFQHDNSCDAAPLTHSPFDEEFLARAIKAVQNHLSDKAYGVNQFSDDMCASRMTLYRKIHAITGQSPSEFITTIRLKHAAHLLETSTLSIALVSEHTGFSSPSFFAKQFAKMFGCLPKDYRGHSL